MTLIRAQVVLRTVDNLPENYITNTIYFDTTTEAVAACDEVAGYLETFYGSLRTYMSDLLSQNGHNIKFYFQDQPTPNFPFHEVGWNFSAALTGNPLPSECAIVCSFQGTKVNGVNQASRRGRIYLGPLNDSTNVDGLVQPGIQQAISLAMKTLTLDMGGGTDPVPLHVFSPTLGTSTPVVDGWVDNAFDTQRRRGIASTVRDVWDLS